MVVSFALLPLMLDKDFPLVGALRAFPRLLGAEGTEGCWVNWQSGEHVCLDSEDLRSGPGRDRSLLCGCGASHLPSLSPQQ